MNEAVSRVREQGTVVTVPTSGQERIDAIRKIVTEGQYAKVDGCMIDLFSAGAIVAVYDAINEKQKANYCEKKAPVMASIAFKVLNYAKEAT